MTLVEKIAAAIDEGSAYLLPGDDLRRTAIAVLNVLRKTDQDLIDLMDRELGNGECRKWAEASWMAVIDAAIAEAPIVEERIPEGLPKP